VGKLQAVFSLWCKDIVLFVAAGNTLAAMMEALYRKNWNKAFDLPADVLRA